MEFWNEKFKEAYELLSDSLYLPPGRNYNVSPGGSKEAIDDKKIRLIDLKYEIDTKIKYGKIENNYRKYAIKIYKSLGIEIKTLEVVA